MSKNYSVRNFRLDAEYDEMERPYHTKKEKKVLKFKKKVEKKRGKPYRNQK